VAVYVLRRPLEWLVRLVSRATDPLLTPAWRR
jgi:hypothetical protein